jgi:hypothetical protein
MTRGKGRREWEKVVVVGEDEFVAEAALVSLVLERVVVQPELKAATLYKSEWARWA